MKYLFRSSDVPQSKESLKEIVLPETSVPATEGNVAVSSTDSREKGAKVAAIVAAMHHHAQSKNDVRAKVAAIAAALHHHELENSQGNHALAGVAAVVAAIHHHKKTKQ